MLILFNKQPVNGVYLQERPEVYRLSDSYYLIEYKGNQYVCGNFIEQLYVNISGVDRLKRLQYMGTSKDEWLDGSICHFYLSDEELYGEKRGLIITNHPKKDVHYHNFIGYKQVQGVEVLGDYDVYETRGYCVVRSGIDFIINLKTGEVVSMKNVGYIGEEYIEQAIVSNKLEFLKKLAEMYDNGIKYLGRYNLRRISPSRVSLEDLWQESQKAEAKEMLFTGYSRAVYNLVKALEYKDRVKGWGAQFSNYKVIVNDEQEIRIFKDESKVAEFTDRLKWEPWFWCEKKEDSMVYDLCHKYSLCNKQLSKNGLKKWAGFLKRCKVEGI